MSNNNQFSNFTPKGTPVLMLPEWTGFLRGINQLLNNLFNSTYSNTAVMKAGTVTVTIQGVKPTSNVQAIMQIGGTQTGFLQAKCILNAIIVTSTVNTDAGTIYFSIVF